MINDVIEIDRIIGMPVLSRSSGNRLGEVRDLYVDPACGVLIGVTIKAPNGRLGGIDYRNVFSFGRDAVMIDDENSVTVITEEWFDSHPHAGRHLVGTNVMTEAGNHLGEIGNVYLQLARSPLLIYELRGSLWDKLLGRNLFIYAAQAGALSSSAERLIVSNAVAGNAAPSLGELVDRAAAPPSERPATRKRAG